MEQIVNGVLTLIIVSQKIFQIIQTNLSVKMIMVIIMYPRDDTGLLENQCIVFNQKCFWDGTQGQTVSDCSGYLSDFLCLNTNNTNGIPCFWDVVNTKCIEKTYENKPTSSSSQLDYDNQLKFANSTFNNNSCVEDCTQAVITNITHEQFEKYYLNKSCTLKVDIIQFNVWIFHIHVLLRKNLNFIKRYGKLCYFQASSNQCVDLKCINIYNSQLMQLKIKDLDNKYNIKWLLIVRQLQQLFKQSIMLN
ncbi:unnamed protein product [Paramecium sonneborni]|uniref:Uncharacterized protein n=1 Tax=Paramecium sonneborni TaxID=65129 RepID=A0A8S1RQQ6_9CILI|nr:unnamed protein product [Paramecium sonneborni]